MQPNATPLLETTRRTRRKVFGATTSMLVAFALLAAAAPARASGEIDWNDHVGRVDDSWADGQLVDVQLRVDGEVAPLYWAPGRFDRRYVQAFAGRNYSIVLHNNTGRRVAVLLAVDGLNAVNGELTTLRPNEPMYVLGPWEQATIRGWRSSLDEIRRFVFVDERKSYAQRTGQSNSDMGWIRVLAFREQLPWWQTDRDQWGHVKRMYRDEGMPVPQSREDSNTAPQPVPDKSAAPQASDKAVAPPAPSAVAPETDGLMRFNSDNRSFPGTGWGERRTDRVQRVEFTPDPVAVDKLIFRYEYASGLRALGIDPFGDRWRERLGDRDSDLGFAKPPTR